jgi:predicted O-methyltransferase YrrM
VIPTISKYEFARPALRDYFANPYLNREETGLVVALMHEVEPKVVIEFGVQLGRTAKMLLANVPSIERYVGIDVPHHFEPTLQNQQSEVPETAGLYARSDPRFDLMLCADGSAGLRVADLPRCQAVFIDGDHSEGGVSHDSDLARAVVQPGGIIIYHDYGNPAAEVTAALNGFVRNGWPIRRIEGTWLAYMFVE